MYRLRKAQEKHFVWTICGQFPDFVFEALSIHKLDFLKRLVLSGQEGFFPAEEDSAGNHFFPENKNIYLWSYGANKKPDFSNVEEAFRKQNNKNVDDIVISIYRSRYIFED